MFNKNIELTCEGKSASAVSIIFSSQTNLNVEKAKNSAKFKAEAENVKEINKKQHFHH